MATVQLPFQRLLENNDLGIIENPLRRIDEDDLIKDIRDFHRDGYLASRVDLDVLVRGGLLARDEEATITEAKVARDEGDEITERILNEMEVEAVHNEKSTSIWRESKELKLILLTCCVASVVQGWAQGAIVGANSGWPGEFGLRLGFDGPDNVKGRVADIWKFSATNAIVYFAASTTGALLCDPLTELFAGRRGALFVSAIFTFAASIGGAYTHSWQNLFACRL